YLAGFAALRQPRRFGGLVLASARLKSEFLEQELRGAELPKTLVLHSESDAGIAWPRAKEHVQRLIDAGADVEIFLHEAGHRLPPEAVRHVAGWLERKGFHG
ncbi:MAG: hypothetical protein L0Z55_11905, partial [Planctomycetes bacterium]|nr:hypothetical protein [Planctomycetota bacterium]